MTIKSTNTGVRPLAKETGYSIGLVSKKLSQGKSPDQIRSEAVEFFSRKASRDKVNARREAVNTPEPEGNRIEFGEAQRRKEVALAKLRELELKQEQGELVNADKVAETWAEICTTIRDSMLSIPVKMASKLAALTDERRIVDLLRTAIRSELSRISTDLDEQSKRAA